MSDELVKLIFKERYIILQINLGIKFIKEQKFVNRSYKAPNKVSVVIKKATPKIIIAAKKTFKVKAKTKKVTATLKNNKGKLLKKGKLTLKIGKKTYYAKINSKGVSTFKVKLTKKGKYNAYIKYAGNKYYKAISKKVKITVK